MYQHNEAEAKAKLNPSLFNSRWYAIRELKKTIEFAINTFIQPGSPSTLVDYGCGSQPYKPLILPFVKEYIGADLPINPKIDAVINEEGRLELPDNSVDFVLSTQVLEHVADPDLYLSEAIRVLKKDGTLILTTHGIWMYHPDPTDYWRWTSAGLTKVVEKAGFETIHFSGILGRSAIGLQLFQDGFIFKIPKFILPIFCLIMQQLISLADKTTRQSTKNYDAANFLIVAKKIGQL